MSGAPPPLAPADAATSAAAGNPLLDWLNLVDTDGGLISHYRLILEPGFYNILHRVVYSGLVEFCYTVFLVLAAWGAAGLELILTPDRWLSPLTDFYNTVTSRLYQTIPPLAIVALSFGALVFSVFMRPNLTPPGPPGRPPSQPPRGWLEQWAPSNTQISTAQWNRLGSGMVLMALVVILIANPFKLIQNVVNAVVAVASELTFTATDGGAATYAARGVTDILRTVTFMINYRDLLAPECAQQWSQTINAGGANPSCLTHQQYAAADPDMWTVVMALLAIPIAWGIAKFLWVVAKALFNHLGLTVVYLIGATWVAAATIARRRPYDPLVTLAAKFGEHFLITVGVLFTTAAGPALFVRIFTDVGSFLPMVLQVPLVSLAFYVSAKLIEKILSNRGQLVDLFSDRIKKSETWTNLYNLKADQKTVTGQLMPMPSYDQLAAPFTWATGQYQQAQQWTQQRWAQVRADLAGAPTAAPPPDATQEGQSMTVHVQPDTPESLGAQRRISLGQATAPTPAAPLLDPDRPEDPWPEAPLAGASTPTPPPPLHDSSSPPDHDPAAHPVPAAAPIALVAADGTIHAVEPAGPDTPPGAPGYAWERGGIPHFAPSAVPLSLPAAPRLDPPAQRAGIATDQHATPPPAPPSTTPPADLTGPTDSPAEHRPATDYDPVLRRDADLRRIADALRTETGRLPGIPRPDTRPDDNHLLAAAARNYHPATDPAGHPVAPIALAGQHAPPPRQPRRDLRSVLASAQWLHNVQRAKNLLAARGVTAQPRLSEAALSAQRILFTRDSQGRVVVRRKNDRGFGDSL